LNIRPTSVLIVEDEREIAEALEYALTTEGYQTTWVSTGQDAMNTLNAEIVNFLVLDVGLPDINGFELLKAIRTNGEPYADLPCLFLTARSEEIDRIIGLEIGADDYVCKPFSPREVAARIKTILKRFNTSEHNNTVISSAFVHNEPKREITYENRKINLTRSEYILMTVFLKQTDQVFSRRELINLVWSDKHPSDDRAIDTHIKTLRAKLAECDPDIDFIKTHRGHGYSFRSDC